MTNPYKQKQEPKKEKPPATTKGKKRKFVRVGGIWLKRTIANAAGNSKQYMTIQIEINNKTQILTAWPNWEKTKPDQPDFIVSMSHIPKWGEGI